MEKNTTHCQIIPNRLIMKSNHAHRKIIINKKFQWLSKYLCAQSPKLINPDKFVSTSKLNPTEFKKRTLSFAGSKLQTREIQQNYLRSQMIKTKNWHNDRHRRAQSTCSQFIKQQKQNIFQVQKAVKKKNNAGRPHRSYYSSEPKQPRSLKTEMDRKIEQFTIEPWNNNDSDEEVLCVINHNRLRTQY